MESYCAQEALVVVDIVLVGARDHLNFLGLMGVNNSGAGLCLISPYDLDR